VADVPTQLDLFDAGRREALLSPTRFDAAIIDVPGSDVNILFNVAATMGEEVARFLQAGFNGLFLSTANGDALDRWVFDRYGLTRFEAQSAVATLQLTRADTAVGVTIPSGSTFSTIDGQVFETVVDAVFAAGNGGPLFVSAVAQRTGTEGNVAAGTITVVTASLPVQDILVDNPNILDEEGNIIEPGAAAGGRAAETDDEFRERARQFFVNARRGTKSAIEFGALQVPRVAQATAIENLNTETGDPGFRVQLNIADVDGQSNPALAEEVSESLDEFRALGVPVSIINAIPEYVNIVAEGLQFEAGANTAAVLSEARNRILAVVNGIPPAEILRRAAIINALESTELLIVPNDALIEPAGDLVPTLGTVIRTTADRITLSP